MYSAAKNLKRYVKYAYLNQYLMRFIVMILLQDEKNQILTTNCWVTQIWTDHHLKWNVSEFAGIRVIRVPYNRVWRPDTILYNK